MTPPPSRRLRAARCCFVAAGLGYSAWAALVPFAAVRAGLSPGRIGPLLLCLAAGSVAAMPCAGVLAGRFGGRAVLLPAGLLLAAMLPALALLPGIAPLAVALAAFGAGVGAMDVAMNTEAIAVEREAGRPLLSGLHGLFSLGGICGAGGMALLLRAGAAPAAAAGAVAACVSGLVLLAAPGLGGRGGGGGGAPFAVPRGAVLLLGALCFVLFLVEGAVLDWSALFLDRDRGARPALSGLGYACFSAAMVAGRLGGDALAVRLGRRRVVAVGGVLAATGFGVAVASPDWLGALPGFALVGLGCSNIVPILFAAAGRQRAMPEAAAVSAIATLGYAGMLAGPAAIGLLARLHGLGGAFALLGGLLLLVAAAARQLPPG